MFWAKDVIALSRATYGDKAFCAQIHAPMSFDSVYAIMSPQHDLHASRCILLVQLGQDDYQRLLLLDMHIIDQAIGS